MLEQAQGRSGPAVRFELRSIEDIEGEWDLIFSNAAIQWVHNHRELVPTLFSHLRTGGHLVVQLPSNHNHPTQDFIAETGNEEPYRKALKGWSRSFSVLTVREYAELLYQTGGEDIVVFEKVYPHVLRDSYAILDWLSAIACFSFFELERPTTSSINHKI